MSFEDRREILAACRHVDLVIPEHDWKQKAFDCLKYDVDIFAMGDDWTGKFDNLSTICEVLYLPRAPDISTKLLKQHMTQATGQGVSKLH